LIYHLRPATPNIGNDLIVLALQMLMDEVAPRPIDVVTLPARGTDAVIKTAGLSRGNVNEINQIGAGLLVGPGNLFENGGLDLDAVALDALRRPLLVFSVSWGRIYDDEALLHPRTDAMGREATLGLCRKAQAVLVRDSVTKGYLEGLGFDGAEVVGCPVLALDPSRLALPGSDPRAAGATLVSVRNPLLMNISPRLQGRVFSDVRGIIDGLRSMGHTKLGLLCHDPRDLRFAAAFPDVPALYTEQPLRYLSWLRDCRLSVTFRLHSLLPCAVLGVPSVHLTYDERALGLIETARLGACEVNYVSARSPVSEALEKCGSPEALTAAADAARPAWAELRRLMTTRLSQWYESLP